MQKVIGVICLVLGVLFLVWGHNVSQSVGSQIKQAFTGSPIEKATYFYAGGAVLLVVGLFQIFWNKSK